MTVCILIIALLALIRAVGLALVPLPPDVTAARKWTDTREPVRIDGFVSASETREEYSYIILKRAVLYADSNRYELNKVRVTLKNPQHYAVGSFLCAKGILREPEPASNEGQFDRKTYYRMLGIYYTMGDAEIEMLDSREDPFGETLYRIRAFLVERIAGVFSPRTAGVLGAMLVGDRTLMETEDSDRFREAGISHVLVISGLHITMMAEAFCRLLCAVPLAVPVREEGAGDRPAFRVRIRHMDKKAASVLTMVLLTCFAFMTGLSVSTVRAVIMYCLAAGARLAGRTYDAPTGVSLAAAVILIVNPEYLTYSGFQLSFLAVILLGLCPDRGPLVRGVILYLGSVPFVLWSWYEIPLYSIFLNMLIVPLIPFVLGAGILGILCGGAAGGIFTLPAEALVKLLYFILRLTGRLPFASLICGRPEPVRIFLYGVLFAVFFVLSARWRTDRKRFLLIGMIPILLSVFLIRGRDGLEIHMLDIGQGDAIVLEMPGGQNVLLDGGSTTVTDVGRGRILPFLRYEGIRKLDYIFVTHTDLDHISGITEILDGMIEGTTSLRAETLVLPYLREKGEAYEELCGKAERAHMRVIRVKAGDAFRFGGPGLWSRGASSGDPGTGASFREVSVTVLGPDPGRETVPVNVNAQCIVAALSFGKFDCLLTGDVVEEGEENLLEILRRTGKEFEVLKVAHHGSKYSTPEELLSIVRPDLCLISAGRYNRYGHPHAELLDRLYAAGADVRITRYGGELSVATDGEAYRFRAFKGEEYAEETYVCR